MPSFRVHCKISEIRTGKKYEELHRWIDYGSKETGINHRTKRHAYNLKEEKYIIKNFGEKAVSEWLFHITLDNLETSMKRAKLGYRKGNIHNFFKFGFSKENKYIFFDEKSLSQEKLLKEFKDSYEEIN